MEARTTGARGPPERTGTVKDCGLSASDSASLSLLDRLHALKCTLKTSRHSFSTPTNLRHISVNTESEAYLFHRDGKDHSAGKKKKKKEGITDEVQRFYSSKLFRRFKNKNSISAQRQQDRNQSSRKSDFSILSYWWTQKRGRG